MLYFNSNLGGIVTLIVLSRKGPHGFPFRRPHSRFPIQGSPHETEIIVR